MTKRQPSRNTETLVYLAASITVMAAFAVADDDSFAEERARIARDDTKLLTACFRELRQGEK